MDVPAGNFALFLFRMHRELGIGHVDALFIEEQLERAVERAARGENVLLRRGYDELEHNAALAELFHADILRHIKENGAVFLKHGGQRIRDHGFYGA